MALKEGGEVDFDNEIIFDKTFEDNLKIKCAFNKLLQTGEFKNLLVNFIGNNDLVKLKFTVVNNLTCTGATNPTGCTLMDFDNGICTIKLSEQFINSYSDTGIETPLLFLCKTLLHESIHANLYYYQYQLMNGIEPSSSDFETLYESYRINKGWQHNYMANHYLSYIVEGLVNVHPLLDDDTFIQTHNDWQSWNWNDFYKALSWTGLEGTTSFNDYFQINQQNYNDYYSETLLNSNKTPNCN